MKWINAGDIKSWIAGNKRQCEQTLPELVRRLILAHTAFAVKEFDFPSGDSITGSGWDGRLETLVVSPFFPTGRSGWEISTEKSAEKKAELDYKKRTAKPLGMIRKETTFMFVTARPWTRCVEWENKKRKSKKWKDVRVINANGLEQWLDSAPAVALRLARKIGKVISGGIRDLEAFWEEWSAGTNPIMRPELVISGRTSEVEKIQNWIEAIPSVLEVQGDHPDEAFAFLYATIAALSEAKLTQALARCVVVENINELRQLTQAFQNYPLIIAGPGECINAAHAAVVKGHHVFVSMDSKVMGIREILQLSRPRRDIVERLLHDGGLKPAEAQRLARDFGRSIPVLRRHLYNSAAVSAPGWANNASTRLLLPVLFASAWNDQKDGDRKVIESLSGLDYATFAKEVEVFLHIEDAPIHRIGSVWKLTSQLDAWFMLAQHLNNDLLNLFQNAVLAVLTETDPKYDLPAEQRWAASVYGKSSQYSEWLRTGLVESLVLLAVFGNRSPRIASTKAFTDNVVEKIFEAAQKWEMWASLKDVTPLLAEASPDVFIEIVEKLLAENPTLFEDFLRDDGSIFGECKHSGLLWAFESVAWSSQYLTRAVSILSDLAEIDPGGRWANRPINSLKGIFMPKYPQTHALPAERLTALDVLISKKPIIVWKFAQEFFDRGVISESYRFRWRDAGGHRRGLEPERNEEYIEYLKGLLPKLNDVACMRENLVNAVDEFTRLPPDMCQRLIKELEASDPSTFSKEERSQLNQKIRDALNWISNYGDKEKKTHIPGLNRILERFSPEDVVERVGWLLRTPWPRMPGEEPKDYHEKEAVVKKEQEKAARELLDKVSLQTILDFTATVGYPGVVGYAIGKAVSDDNEDAAVLDTMLEHLTGKSIPIIGYAGARVEIVGPGWIDRQIERMKARGNYTSEACALLYFGLSEGSETWSAVSSHGKEVENAYWKIASGRSRKRNNEEVEIAVEKLLYARRPDTALTIAGDPEISLPSLILKRLIQELLVFGNKDRKLRADTMDAFYLGHIFKQLYERNELSLEEIAKLEWPFATIFDDLKKYTSSALAIHRILQKDATFFAQLVTWIYKRDDHAPDPNVEKMDKESIEKIARNAREVLDSWHLMPGRKEDGSLDEKELSEWVDTARRKCTEANRITGGDIQMGFMLAHAPGDDDGTWPHTAVRNLIERLNNEVIELHIRTGVYNSRGVTSRGIGEGGIQERELSKRYRKMSDSVKVKWPRTARMLRSMADSYEEDAKRQDYDAELFELR